MATTEYVLQSLADVERHVKLLTAATGPDRLLGALSGYLSSWTKDRIERLQEIDGGWGTFDSRQRPKPIHGVADVVRISDSLGGHCLALNEAGIAPTAELLELDLYFTLAKQVAEKFISAERQRDMLSIRRGGYHHWSDRDPMPA